MKKLILALSTALIAIAGTAATVAQGKTSSSKAGADMCVLLPDPKSSVRWETQDRPAFVAAFKKAGSTYVIDNANGDAQKQVSQAQQCIGNGAKVVILVSLDAGSSLTIEKAAKAGGAKVIEYDRQVEGGKPSIYISFDGKAVGVLQGKGVVAGLKADGKYGKKPVVAELNGGQTDQNSFLFKGGYESVLNPLYKNGTFQKGPNQFVPGLGQPEGRHDLRADARQDEQQDRRRRSGERRSRQRRRGCAQGPQAQPDPAQRPGCNGRRAFRTSSPAGRP